ncbi:MAG: hypothetical protein KBF46_00530 [Aminivibrio sp.]|nr:hypothetical protein [Aminivibrio sp.]
MENSRLFRCASCGKEFRLGEGERTLRCPSCGSKVLILLEGESLSRKKCGGCSGGSCST